MSREAFATTFGRIAGAIFGGGGYAEAEVGDEGVDYWSVDDGDADFDQVLGVHEVPEGASRDSSRERDGYEEHGVDGLRDGGGGDVAQP